MLFSKFIFPLFLSCIEMYMMMPYTCASILIYRPVCLCNMFNFTFSYTYTYTSVFQQ